MPTGHIGAADAGGLSADTDVLTSAGWKPGVAIQVDDVVASFDLETCTYSWSPVEKTVVEAHDGDAVSLNNKSLDCLVMPGQRVVLRRFQRAKGRVGKYPWTFCRADKVPTCVGIPIGGAPTGNGVPGLSIEDARILGWILTDGSNHDISRGDAITITQSTSTVKAGVAMAQEIDSVLMARKGIYRSHRPARTTLGNRRDGRTVHHAPSMSWHIGVEVARHFRQWIGTVVHRIPRKILVDGSRDQLTSLYRGMLEGDGTFWAGHWLTFFPGKNGELADDFQELAARLGVSSTKSFVRSNEQWHVKIARRREHWIKGRAPVRYSGLRWSLVVGGGTFVARRHGRMFVAASRPRSPEDGP